MRGLWGAEHHTLYVGHIETRHEEGGGNTDGADVGFNVRFAVEVVNVGEFSIAEFVDVKESGPDEVLYADFLGRRY